MDLQRFNELWEQAEAIERTLRLLLPLRFEIANVLHVVSQQQGDTIPPFSGTFMTLLETLSEEVTLIVPETVRTSLRSIKATLDQVFGIAAGEERSLTFEEYEKVIGLLKELALRIDPLIGDLRVQESIVWEQIGRLTDL